MKNSGSDLRQPPASWKVAPFWRAARSREYPTLTEDKLCDVAIIGGGIVGLSAALEIGKSQRVVLLEGGKIAEGSSGFSAGVISLSTTVDLRIIEEHFGRDKAELLYLRLSRALDRILPQLNLGGDALQEGVSIYAASKESHLPILSTERETRSRYGLTTRFQDKANLPSWLQGFHGALYLEGERGVNPVKLVEAIARLANDQGSEIFENTEVFEFEHRDGYFVLKAGLHTVKARHLLIATGVHGKKWTQLASVNRLLVPVKGDIIVTEPSADVARLVKEEGTIAMWDTYQMLYVYTRYLPDGRILSGGADSPGVGKPIIKNPAEDSVRRLHAVICARHNFPIPPVAHAWQASFSLPADGLPLLKQLDYGDNRLIVASTDGLPSGILLGEVIADMVAGKDNDLLSILRQDRKPSMEARLLSWLPNIPSIRNLTLKLVFLAMKWKDILS
jgi:gamma-glutamylputrescine oxidase